VAAEGEAVHRGRRRRVGAAAFTRPGEYNLRRGTTIGGRSVELLDARGVLGVIGNVGTPTAVAAIPVALERNALFWGAFTGAGTLRKSPPDRCVFNYRASYAQETAAMVDALIDQACLAPAEIAFFTQRDA